MITRILNATLFGTFLVFFTAFSGNSGTLLIELENVKTTRGTVWVGIYDSRETFMIKEKALVQGFEVEQTGILTLEFPALAYGNYAFAIFQDLNENGKLDQNLLGIPTEPYAFSREPVSRFRAPRYEEVNFDFGQDRQKIRTTLKKWWD